MAAEAAKIQPETAPQEAPQETPQAAPETHWTKKPFEGGSLEAAEKAAEMRGLGKEFDEKAEAETKKFDEETKSWWGRAKERLFRKKEGGAAPAETPAVAKGEAEILGEIEKADAVFAEFRKKAAEIMASGDEAGLRMLERSLSKSYEDLAPQVAAEGANEAKAMKKALKTGEMPQITETGAKLNYVAKNLADVRARLNGAPAPAPEAPPKPQAEIVEEAAPAEEDEIFTEAEKAQLAADAAKLEASAQESAPKEPASRIPSLNEVLTGRPDVEAPAEQPATDEPVAAPEAPKTPEADTPDRALLMKASAGKPGEKLVDEYLKLRATKSDPYGTIVGHSFDPIKGEIRLKYEDGSQFRKYANGLMLRIHPGGQVEEIPGSNLRKAEMAARVDAAMKAQDRAEMAARVDAAMEAEDAAVMSEGVVSGEIEAKEPAAEPAPEPSVVVEPQPPMKVVTSEQSPTASGTIGGEAEVPTLSVEPGPDLEMSPAPMKSPRETYPNLPEPLPGSRPPGVPEAPAVEKPAEAPAASPEAAPEAPESAFGKLEAKLDDAAAELLKMPEAAESPKTFPTKVGKLPADKFLEAFKAVGAVDAQGAKDFAEQFKMDSEGFDALRKKLAQVVRKKMKG